MSGGMGDGIYVVDNAGDQVVEAANAGAGAVEASIDYTLGANLENITPAGAADAQTGYGWWWRDLSFLTAIHAASW